MSPWQPWKQTERRVAALLGCERIPITGRQRGDVPDARSEWMALEIKHRRTLPGWLLDAVDQARAGARAGQLPAVVLHQEGDRHDHALVAIRMDDFRAWFGEEA